MRFLWKAGIISLRRWRCGGPFMLSSPDVSRPSALPGGASINGLE